MNKLKKYAGLLNDEAPKDHFLAYITGNERDMLVQAGGSGHITKSGIPSFEESWDMSVDYSSGGSDNNNQSDQNDNQPDYSNGGDLEEEAAQIPGYKEYGATGWSGDAGVDTWESQHGDQSGSDDYQGTIFTGGTYATDDTPASRTISYGNDALKEDKGRPDITYFEPTGTLRGNHKSKYEMNQIKYIQDSNLKTIKAKLNTAGFTNLPKDANFQETKDYINQLNRQGKILDSWENATDKHGNPLYEKETIDKWKEAGYNPQSATTKHWTTTVFGAAPLSYNQLMGDFKAIEEVGKSGGGAMDWQERTKTFQPNRYATMTGTIYNPVTKTFTPKDEGSDEGESLSRVTDPYTVGGTTPPQQSQVVNYFANLNNTGSGINQNYLNTYNTAKTNIANTLNMTPNTQQYGYGNTFNDNYARSMTSANPFFDELTSEGLI